MKRTERKLSGVRFLGVTTCTDCWTHALRAVVDVLASLDPECLDEMEFEGVNRFRTRRIFARDASLLAPGRDESCSQVSGGWWVNMGMTPEYVEKSLRKIAKALGWNWGRDIQFVFVGE